MRIIGLTIVLAIGPAIHGRAADALLTQRLQLASPVAPTPIVGRAACGASVWVLNRASELIEISAAGRRASPHTLRGLRPDARPWGLACVADGRLWTLETPRSLARIERDGRVVEHLDLTLPRVALFAAGDRLVFQQLPSVVSAPLLVSSLPGHPLDVRGWLGLVGRTTRSGSVSGNLLNCGIGSGAAIPCWFIDDGAITVSDGARFRTHVVPGRQTASIDLAMPIWDAALAGSDGLWVLLTSSRGTDGRHAAGRLLRIDRDGRERHGMDLNPLARLIVEASSARCVLLTVLGQLLEVSIT